MKNLLDEYREQIDEIDNQLIEMLGKRTEVVRKIGVFKRENNIDIVNEERWKRVIDSRKALARKYGLSENFITDMFNMIHDESVEIEKKS